MGGHKAKFGGGVLETHKTKPLILSKLKTANRSWLVLWAWKCLSVSWFIERVGDRKMILNLFLCFPCQNA